MRDIESIISEYRSLNLHDVIDYDKFNQFSIVHHSSSIEGSTLTENETRLLLEEGITPNGKPLEHSLMVKDHYDALLYVLDAAPKRMPLTVDFIRAGRSYFVNYEKVKRYTTELVNKLNNEFNAVSTIEEQLQLSFLAHFDLVSIHPFYDGNGCTSRLLMN